MRERRFTIWVVLAILLLVLLNLPAAQTLGVKNAVRSGLAPLQESVSNGWHRLREGWATVRGLGGMAIENQRMATEVARLLGEVRDLKLLERENEQLRSVLGFTSRAQRDLIPAEVIARSRDGWWQTLRLNKGAEHGAAPNQAVISVDGLVGRVLSVSGRTSDVLLLSDPTCRVSAQILRTGAFGIVSGRGPQWDGSVVCRMEFINKNIPVQPGDEVITSGLGGVFPRGLLIGYVDRVSTDRSGLYQYADIISKADLGTLQYVFAVRDASPGAPYLRVQQEGARP
ncbi:MAG: rod shape-determining protein MreC [Kiritimatiellae bacterium]|nr:rod shape-determining protein MreC [Kiritimatiellia bacterium]MCO5062028.1 rod shape-determining protein MreC [Kiritimatiellia bacterium]MCO5069281.1 rod shape-determining protein MreC [Kiritimatiellia bacterium]MCO6401633.1 rod shape-determining protein MreC [Verrucomicrobiota bacterium]